MKQRIGVIAAWVVATAISVAIASSAVATVQDEVTASPSPLQAQAVQQLAASTTRSPTSVAPSTSQAPEATSTTDGSVAGTTSTSSTTPAPPTSAPSSSTTAPPVTTSPTTTIATTTTTTTVATPPSKFVSYELTGGLVRIRIEGEQVWFEGATPAPGFSVELRDRGPNKVSVEFESGGHESKFRAEFEDGELEITLDEGDDD